MSNITKIPIAGYPFAQPGTLDATGSTHGVVYSSEVIGGYQEVATLDDRNAIPVNVSSGKVASINEDLFSSGRRRIGMTVYVASENKTYRLIPWGYFGNGGNLDENDWASTATHLKVLALDPRKVIKYGGLVIGKGNRTVGPITGTTSSWGIVTGYTAGTPIINPNVYSGSTVSPWVEVQDVRLANSVYNDTTGEITYNLTDGSTAVGYIYDTPHLYTLNINVSDTNLTVNEPSDYESGNNDNPDLYLSRGETYIFRNNATGHTLEISRTLGDINDAPVGLTNNGATYGTDLIFKVPQDANDTYWIYSNTSSGTHKSQLIITGAGGTGTTQSVYHPAVPLSTETPEKVGGIEAGTLASALDGNTFSKMFDLILFPTITPTLSNPYESFAKTNDNLYEIGDVINVDGLVTFNRGSILEPWNGDTLQNYRSGLPNAYEFYFYTGNTVSYTNYLYTIYTSNLTYNFTENGYSIIKGYQNWLAKIFYDPSTNQPLDNYGGNYLTPLASGTTESHFVIEGVYPIYATTYTGTFTTFPALSPGYTGFEGITSQTKQTLYSMISGNNIELILASEPNYTDRQKFWLPDEWLSDRPITKVELYDTSSNQWGTPNFLSMFTQTPDTINSLPYTQFEYNGTLRGFVKIRLRF